VKIANSQYTMVEIHDMLERQALVVNTEYQRSPRIWPSDAKSYFIDTVLEGYPFPKVYFYETYDRHRKKPRREIVDGQQRITTLDDFYKNAFRLTSASRRHKGLTFEELPEDKQQLFVMTPVQVDIILSAERSEILEMFRRMNAYTVPLNPAEQRHSGYQGSFKWFIVDMADEVSPVLEQFAVFSPKQILRMADAEFLTELALVLDVGITTKSAQAFKNIYSRYDEQFPSLLEFAKQIPDFFRTLGTDLSELQGTFLMKPYVIYSLFCAMTQRKYGIPGGESLRINKAGRYFDDRGATVAKLRELAAAHEIKDEAGPYAEYVRACLSGTHRADLRKIRARYLGAALQ
jgi:hypothetical protein